MMKNNNPDIIVTVCVVRDISIWKHSTSSLKKYFPNSRIITSVPERDYPEFIQAAEGISEIITDESMLSPEVISEIRKKAGTRSGWYLQQFVKLALLKNYSNFERIIMVWDSDTVIYKKFPLINKSNKILFGTTNEYHLPYFENIYSLLKIDKQIRKSFISQYFVCKSKWINALINELSYSQTWEREILSSIDFREECGFSEYELIGNYVMKNWPDEISENQEFRMQRWGNSQLGGIQLQTKVVVRFLRRNYNAVAYEAWDPLIGLSKVTRIHLRKIYLMFRLRISRTSFRKTKISHSKEKNEHILDIKSIMEELRTKSHKKTIVQIGANDGVQNDTLREYIFEGSQNIFWILIEPLPYYFQKLNQLYGGRPDVLLVNKAAGKESGLLKLFFLDPEIAEKMNGEGPINNWAHGQGSISRAKVVKSIFENDFRGASYVRQIPKFIEGIRDTTIPVSPTDDFLKDQNVEMLVIDVQGFEVEVLKGMNPNNLPKYIVVENEFDDERIQNYLSTLNYVCASKGHDLIFIQK